MHKSVHDRAQIVFRKVMVKGRPLSMVGQCGWSGEDGKMPSAGSAILLRIKLLRTSREADPT